MASKKVPLAAAGGLSPLTPTRAPGPTGASPRHAQQQQDHRHMTESQRTSSRSPTSTSRIANKRPFVLLPGSAASNLYFGRTGIDGGEKYSTEEVQALVLGALSRGPPQPDEQRSHDHPPQPSLFDLDVRAEQDEKTQRWFLYTNTGIVVSEEYLLKGNRWYDHTFGRGFEPKFAPLVDFLRYNKGHGNIFVNYYDWRHGPGEWGSGDVEVGVVSELLEHGAAAGRLQDEAEKNVNNLLAYAAAAGARISEGTTSTSPFKNTPPTRSSTLDPVEATSPAGAALRGRSGSFYSAREGGTPASRGRRSSSVDFDLQPGNARHDSQIMNASLRQALINERRLSVRRSAAARRSVENKGAHQREVEGGEEEFFSLTPPQTPRQRSAKEELFRSMAEDRLPGCPYARFLYFLILSKKHTGEKAVILGHSYGCHFGLFFFAYVEKQKKFGNLPPDFAIEDYVDKFAAVTPAFTGSMHMVNACMMWGNLPETFQDSLTQFAAAVLFAQSGSVGWRRRGPILSVLLQWPASTVLFPVDKAVLVETRKKLLEATKKGRREQQRRPSITDTIRSSLSALGSGGENLLLRDTSKADYREPLVKNAVALVSRPLRVGLYFRKQAESDQYHFKFVTTPPEQVAAPFLSASSTTSQNLNYNNFYSATSMKNGTFPLQKMATSAGASSSFTTSDKSAGPGAGPRSAPTATSFSLNSALSDRFRSKRNQHERHRWLKGVCDHYEKYQEELRDLLFSLPPQTGIKMWTFSGNKIQTLQDGGNLPLSHQIPYLRRLFSNSVTTAGGDNTQIWRELEVFCDVLQKNAFPNSELVLWGGEMEHRHSPCIAFLPNQEYMYAKIMEG